MLDVTAGMEVPTLAWSNTRIELLITLWAQGLSAAVIGDELGVTRNAVLGKIHRLGKSKARAVTRAKPMRGPDKAPRPKRVLAPRFEYVEPVEETKPPAEFLGVAFADLADSQCRFPRGDVPNITFCGQPVSIGSYCASCHRIAYYQPRPSRTPFMFRSW
jgi:GcrA cell cycle regulator